MDTLIQC